MAYTRNTLEGLTSKQRAGWARRARAIHRRAELLMADVMNAFGEEHPLTDSIDNVLVACEDLRSDLAPQKTK